ncbi:hypothetical protein GWO43_31520 [candidate division KSB1 bacterium]|nr:hypothetical protein [candidate division KSB1 bacterium]NIR73440.1 hypothetical protein [candidate division KSB1 bacterium]NIS28431.1 hypothetical protein [candidate division KSB1 bacterium]NIT75311.1 hypothetical protein [candidate division KSB1 bacterium]NIU29159.1 hypothetical protein [candidate division KSB1 bacterium]
MTHLTLILSSLLIVIGVVGYFGTGMVSVTALIPAFLGLPLLLLNLWARKAESPKTLIPVGAILSGLGFVGSMRGLFKLIAGSFSTAVLLQTVMFLICGIYMFVVIKYLYNAR